MTIKSKLSTETDVQTKQVGFGIKDKAGREKGVSIRTSVVVFTPLPSDARMWNNIAPGTYCAVLFHATRDGSRYGPIQSQKFFLTRMERQAEITRYLKAAQKRA